MFKSVTLNYIKDYSWYLQGFLANQFQGAHLKRLGVIEGTLILVEKDLNNKNVLLNKMKDLCYLKQAYITKGKYRGWMTLSDKEEEQRRQIHHFFNEVLSINWLLDNGYTQPTFVQTKKNKTPDIQVYDVGKNNYWIEVKTIDRPRSEEDKLRSRRIFLSCPKNNLDYLSLLTKVEEKIYDASKKFKNLKDNKILIIFYNTDLISSFEYSTPSLDSLLGRKFFKQKESKYNFRIIRLVN